MSLTAAERAFSEWRMPDNVTERDAFLAGWEARDRIVPVGPGGMTDREIALVLFGALTSAEVVIKSHIVAAHQAIGIAMILGMASEHFRAEDE